MWSNDVNNIEIIKEYKQIIIYGAGYRSRIVCKWMIKNSNTIDKSISIAVNDLTGNPKKICGFEVHRIEEYREEKNKQHVLVVVAIDEKYQLEVNQMLLEYGFKNIWLLKGNDFDRIYDAIDEEVSEKVKICEANTREILNGMNFDRVINESKWLGDKGITAGGAAVSYYYLYIIYRALDSGKFKSVLDIGMGQTSKIIAQYANYDKESRHIIIEDDKDWVDFISPFMQIGERTDISVLESGMEKRYGRSVRCYKGFSERLRGYKFDLISIDAPIGYDMDDVSRVDILEILPECLCDSWVMLLDDVGRKGELNTLERIKSCLQENGIEYMYRIHEGKNKFAVITSYNNRFYCTV